MLRWPPIAMSDSRRMGAVLQEKGLSCTAQVWRPSRKSSRWILTPVSVPVSVSGAGLGYYERHMCSCRHNCKQTRHRFTESA